MTARILAVAEVYDVLTSPDSYRHASCRAAEAEDELRHVAGTQLDGRLVWLFATQVLRGRQQRPPGHIADLEAELQVQRRVRGVLDGPFVLGPPVDDELVVASSSAIASRHISSAEGDQERRGGTRSTQPRSRTRRRGRARRGGRAG